MRTTILATSLIALAAAPAFAGGVERSNQSMAILFERGNYLEFGASYSMPRVSGVANPLLGGQGSGIMSQNFWNLDLRFKGQINEQLSYAVILDQPIGANVAYPMGTGYPIAGSEGTISSTALTGVVRYAFDGGLSVYGGVRAVRTSGSVNLTVPTIGGPEFYTMSTNQHMAYGYLVGAAYEVPAIAARVSLTYNSRITHNFSSVETFTQDVGPIAAGTPFNSTFRTTIPESLHLEFQTGIMEDTLLFGGVRWVRWSQFDISPTMFNLISGGGSLVDYTKPTTTYTLGVGRRFNENWSGAVTVSHEPKVGGISGNLGPTDGFWAVGLGATYTMDNVKISGGLQYRWIGSATTQIGGFNNSFNGNSAISAGMRVGVSF